MCYCCQPVPVRHVRRNQSWDWIGPVAGHVRPWDTSLPVPAPVSSLHRQNDAVPGLLFSAFVFRPPMFLSPAFLFFPGEQNRTEQGALLGVAAAEFLSAAPLCHAKSRTARCDAGERVGWRRKKARIYRGGDPPNLSGARPCRLLVSSSLCLCRAARMGMSNGSVALRFMRIILASYMYAGRLIQNRLSLCLPSAAYFGAGGPPPMDWSFATSRAGAAPAVMSFRQSAPREEQQGLAHFSAFDGVQKQQAPRVLTQQRSFGAENHGSPQYTATRGAYGVPPPQQQKQQHAVNVAYGGQTPPQQHVGNGAYGGQPPQQQQRQHVVNGAYGGHPSQQQHAANGARATPVSSPLNPNNQMFKVQSSPNIQNGVAAGGPFKQPPFAVNNAAVAASRVGVYARNMPKPKMAQLTIFYAGSVNVFNNVSAEKAQELMVLASRGSLPSAPSTVARSPDANLFASRGSLPSAPSTVARSPDANLFTSRGSLPSAPTTVTRSPDANLFASRGSLPSAPSTVTRSPEANLFAPAKVTAAEVSPAKQMLPQMQQRVSPPKPISSVSQAPCLPKSASSSNIDSTVPKSVMPLRSQPPSTHPVTLAATTAEAIMPRAVPQARKASLARFLEKRKERVTTVAPYSSGKSPIESNDTVGSSIENSKSSLTGITISSNREKSVWRPRNISFSGECPSTNLHI